MERDSDIPIDSETMADPQADLGVDGCARQAVVIANDLGRETANLTMQYDYSADSVASDVVGAPAGLGPATK